MSSTVGSFDREKQELEAVIASGILSRAPNLALLMKYICTKYFEGAAEEVKEYNIAVEALGRPPEFDQKRDSIVRVEAHRLRKRLGEYYEGEGASHPVHIEVPPGQYAPRFVFLPCACPAEPQDEAAPEIAAVAVSEPLIPVVPLADDSTQSLQSGAVVHTVSTRGWWWAAGVLLLASVAGAGVTLAHFGESPRTTKQPTLPVPAAADDEIRILAGVEQGSYVDSYERTWISDRYFTGGAAALAPKARRVLGTRDQGLYQNRREGAFRYDIPLQPGVYEMKLHFAETLYGDNNVAGGGETTRIFNVRVNGIQFLPDFDVINDAGSAVADVKVFKGVAPSADGKLHLEFAPITNSAFINAIEIVHGTPGRLLPIRIVARDNGIRDSRGRYWDPDHYAQGGQIIARPDSPVRGGEPELFHSERFGNITYVIPVAGPGRYTVNLYFSENWFGPGMPGGGKGPGSRVFDILVNGIALRRNFDIFREAGGLGKGIAVSARAVEPNHQSKIVIALAPAVNYACINALEILDESK